MVEIMNVLRTAGCSHACSLGDGNPFLTREPYAPLNYAMKVAWFPLQESALYQHMSANSGREHDAVAWDAAPMEEHFTPVADEDETSFNTGENEDEEMDVTNIQQIDQVLEGCYSLICWGSENTSYYLMPHSSHLPSWVQTWLLTTSIPYLKLTNQVQSQITPQQDNSGMYTPRRVSLVLPTCSFLNQYRHQ